LWEYALGILYLQLKYELTKEEYDKILKNMVTFFGTVPAVPNALRGISGPDEVNYCGGFDKMSRILEDMGREYDNKYWIEASEHFVGGAVIVSEIKDVIVAYLIREDDKTDELPKLFTKVMEIMSDGFVLLRV
jgi:hypothetical protein